MYDLQLPTLRPFVKLRAGRAHGDTSDLRPFDKLRVTLPTSDFLPSEALAKGGRLRTSDFSLSTLPITDMLKIEQVLN